MKMEMKMEMEASISAEDMVVPSPSPSPSPWPNSTMPLHHRKKRRPLLGCRASLDPFSTLPVIIPAISDSSTSITDAGYSSASYYTSLGLFVLSVPGVWSLIKRSTKSKVGPSLSLLASIIGVECHFLFLPVILDYSES